MTTQRPNLKLVGAKIHPTAIIESGVQIGSSSAIWDHVHIRKNARIGHNSIIGEKSYIAYDVEIGNFVKINAYVYICAGVRIEDMCMISAGTVFTNDRFPRAMNRAQTALETSSPTEDTLETVVRRGATIGAHATIGPGIELGEFCMVGMGSVVTKSVLPYHLVCGNPARSVGLVCQCGRVLAKYKRGKLPSEVEILCCTICYRIHKLTGQTLQAD